jgi:hypothetical protein
MGLLQFTKIHKSINNTCKIKIISWKLLIKTKWQLNKS